MEEKKNKKRKDLTLGAFHPSEKLKKLGDGTVIRLEDYTNPKSKEDIKREHAGETTEEH